ncbi:MAG: superoxide dismutase [Thermoguttaceae bacterium]
MNPKYLSRRSLLKAAAAGVFATPFFLGSTAARASEAQPFKLPPLPWPEDALAPAISKETISYHYGKHHRAYVNNLNKLVQGTEFADLTLEEVVKKAKPGPIFNNAAQAWNHAFYWSCMDPHAGSRPEGKLAEAIDAEFGSFEKFQAKFTDTAVKLFGSGWVWLVRDAQGKLAVLPTANAGNPLTAGATPLLTCDVWEHAYYLDYKNLRPKYVENFWKIVNWKDVEAR